MHDPLAKGAALTGTISWMGSWDVPYTEETVNNTPMKDTAVVQLKVYVPAQIRRTAKIQAAMRDLSMSRYVAEAVREKVERLATQDVQAA
jgi:post-segregation antitoxin (ccd killing protein)